jgi:hypothetical protein
MKLSLLRVIEKGVVKVVDIPKGVRSEISIFSAFLTIYEGHRRNI